MYNLWNQWIKLNVIIQFNVPYNAKKTAFKKMNDMKLKKKTDIINTQCFVKLEKCAI